MKVRLAALITASAAGLLWYSEGLKSEDLAGICVSSKASRSDVIAACTSLIEDKSTTPEYRHLFLTERAWSHNCNNRHELAIADADQALDLQPDNYRTWILRAQIYASSKNHDAAISDYDKAVELGSQASFTHWKRARYLDKQGQDEEAHQGYERVLELNPNASNAAKLMADHLFDIARYDDALDFVAEATDRWPDQQWVYDRRIQLDVVHSKNVDSALAAAEKAASLSEMELAKYLYPAAVHLTIGDQQEGIVLAEQYSEWYMDARVPKKTIWDRVAGNTNTGADRLVGEKLLRRGVFYASFARGDLARPELLRFLEISGSEGLRALLAIARYDGTQISEDSEANAEYIVDAYIERLSERAPQWVVRYKGNAVNH